MSNLNILYPPFLLSETSTIPLSGSPDSDKERVENLNDIGVLFPQIQTIGRLYSKPATIKRLIELNEEVNKIEKAQEISKQKIVEIEKALESSKKKISGLKGIEKISIVGSLIKNLYSSEMLAQEKESCIRLEGKLTLYLQTIKTLFESLPSEEEEKPSTIFEIENHLRLLLEQEIPEKEKYVRIYESQVLPLIRHAKQALMNKPIHFSVQAASAKGKAAQAAFHALQTLMENKPLIENSKISKQQVFLLPDEGVVFKRLTKPREEEETLVNSIFDIMSKQAVVGTFKMKKVSTEKFEIPISREMQTRGLPLEGISPTMLRFVKNRLLSEERLLLNKLAALPAKVNVKLSNYEQMKNQTWEIQFPEKSFRKFSFLDLQRLYLADKLPLTLQIDAIPLGEHISKDTPFGRALNFLPSLNVSGQNTYLSPDLKSAVNKKAYERCEQFKWSYLDPKDMVRKETNFKSMHALVLQHGLQKEFIEQIKPVSNGSSSFPSRQELLNALHTDWKISSFEIMQIEEGQLHELDNIQAKPFMSDMILMQNLDENVREAVLERLTSDSKFNAILTGEVQLLDLHLNNLGLAPKANAEYEYYKNLNFYIPPYTIRFQNLMTDYLLGHIKSDTLIRFKNDQGELIKLPLSQLPALQKALDVEWQLLIFDTDISLSEDNRLQLQGRSGFNEHLIPLRSALLETEWKDKPLSEEITQRLMQSEERDLLVEQWIKKKDAPIYKRLSDCAKQSIELQVEPFIKRYTLSAPRKNGLNPTVKGLQNQFVEEISTIADPSLFKIWETIEQDLSTIVIRQNDTLDTIAKRYKQNPDELRTLNADGFKAGQKLKIKYDLTSSSFEAVEKRKQIAAQLFPRLTMRQQTALLERQKNRKIYLIRYHDLLHSTCKDKELINQMKEFIEKGPAPLASLRKKELLNQLNEQEDSLLADSQELLRLKQSICQECQPSYFNLMKSMYPLLADAYALNLAVYGNNALAGKNIGLYKKSLEKTINKASKQFDRNSCEMLLVQNMQEQIDAIKEPAIFGKWPLIQPK